MMVKRVVTALITCVIVLIGALGVVGAGVPGAWAESGLTVTATPDNPFASSSTHFLRVSAGTGNVAYCAQGWLICPKVGQSLERYGSLGIPELDYVMWHGYDGSVVRSLYGLDAKRSEAATALAVWLAIADQRGDVLSYHERDGSSYHGNKGYRERWELQSDARVKEAAWKLYQEAIDYKNKGGNGPERNCSTLWINKTPVFVGGKPAFDYQSLITVEKDVSVKFSKVSADVSITAGNGSYPLAGAEYDIFREKDDRKVASIVTDEQGEAVVRLSPNTKYYAIETKAPAGFALSEKRVEFETGLKDSEVEIADRPGTVKIVVSKKDIATLAGPQPGASLSGAEFTVTSKSTAGWSKTGTTDEDGVVTFSGIPLGDIAIVETKAPEGYRIDPTVHEYHVDPSDTGDQKDVELIPENDFLETPLACDIEIAKFNDEGVEGSKVEEPAEGVSFEIISGTTGKVVGTITTNHEGIASTKGEWFGEGSREESIQGALPYDRAGYRVREVPETVPEGFERVDDWTIDREAMVDGTTLHFIVNNSRITSRLRLEKRDAETGGVIPLPGFTFQVLDKDGKPVSMEIWHPFHEMIDTFTTDETGTVTLPEPLPTGSYSIHELAAPAPYLIPETDTPFEIKEGSSTGGITVVSIRDEAAKGRATIEKTCSLDGTSLAGAEFDVVACEDIRAADGSIQVQKGSVFEHVETDERGVAVIDNLPLGSGSARYAFIETVPPKGHALDRTPYEFTVSYRDPSTEVVTTSVEAENEPTTVIVSKIDGQDGSALAEATFQIWRKEDEVAAKPSDGMGSIVIDAGKQVSSVQMDPIPTHAELLVEAPDDVSVAIRDDKGQDMRGGRGALLAPGCHTIECHDGSNGGEKAEFPLTLEAGRRYDVRISRSLFGLTCDVIDEAPISDMFDLVDEDGDGVFSSTEIPPGSYRVGIDGNDCATIEIEQGETHYMKFANGKIKTVPIVLKDGATPPSFTTDQEGTVSIPHLEPGSYRMVEIKCPKGYVMTDQVETFIVTMDGLINGAPRKEIVVAN
ncbi:MAG: SpaA isopeptide-forming pilin-related protein, partial [Collinsella sp.]|nr:SpaA isopeptide-forming pilin-related protein [Collinsella sp.]